MDTYFYFVKPESSEDYFLYKIISTSKQPIFNELLQAYQAAIPTEAKLENNLAQNALGATFENIIVSWENEVSTIRLDRYYSDLETLGIVLTLKQLDAIVSERESGVVEDRAGRL